MGRRGIRTSEITSLLMGRPKSGLASKPSREEQKPGGTQDPLAGERGQGPSRHQTPGLQFLICYHFLCNCFVKSCFLFPLILMIILDVGVVRLAVQMKEELPADKHLEDAGIKARSVCQTVILVSVCMSSPLSLSLTHALPSSTIIPLQTIPVVPLR